jgi:hypothetical protein
MVTGSAGSGGHERRGGDDDISIRDTDAID